MLVHASNILIPLSFINNTIAFAKKEAMAEGEAKGERKKALETALNLKNMDIPLDKIAKATGLRIEEIEHLK
ncbi:hypothetical protein [Sphingobacterium faecale]|uniref:Transposase/invertase (TIGR01784 family) n=1 Tax=Sphingobacterium faecale TaxID=2803775 RepID=A0ABS1RA26_9SPHI|nr:hypothetical protein [Sphingobacterium faecale]MBL1411528.1 hypothetical protein [Sphingobacterium faecale]